MVKNCVFDSKYEAEGPYIEYGEVGLMGTKCPNILSPPREAQVIQLTYDKWHRPRCSSSIHFSQHLGRSAVHADSSL